MGIIHREMPSRALLLFPECGCCGKRQVPGSDHSKCIDDRKSHPRVDEQELQQRCQTCGSFTPKTCRHI